MTNTELKKYLETYNFAGVNEEGNSIYNKKSGETRIRIIVLSSDGYIVFDLAVVDHMGRMLSVMFNLALDESLTHKLIDDSINYATKDLMFFKARSLRYLFNNNA